MRVRRLALPIVTSLFLMITGCTSDSDPAPATPDHTVHFYGTDGNMGDSLGKDLPSGLLDGMKGTLPLTDLTKDFKDRLKSVEPGLTQYNYAGEAYDAAMIAGLAADLAQSTDGTVIAKYVTGVTTGGAECRSAATCLSMIAAGKDISYRGVTVTRSGFTEVGEPSTASYGLQEFGSDNKIDEARTEFVTAGNASQSANAGSTTPAVETGHGPLKMATLLPHTGGLKDMGPSMRAGAELAVAELNAAGGVLGRQIVLSDADDGTDPKVAVAALNTLAASGVEVVIGPSTSSATKAAIPVAMSKGVLLFSPSATSDELTKISDGGLFFRTAPPDVMQASALTNMIMRDGAQRVFIIARDDSWGIGLENAVLQDLGQSGILAKNIKIEKYETDAKDFATEAAAANEFAPDAVLIIGYAESSLIIKAFAAAGVAPNRG
jgi:ABC-type branched-subunit amino acid transport system substrate-binding protein